MGKRSEKMNKLCQELLVTEAGLEEQQRKNAMMDKKIVKLKEAMCTENQNMAKLGRNISSYESTINKLERVLE